MIESLKNYWKGPTQPFQRDGKGDFQTASGADQVRAAIEQILFTRGASGETQGELPWDTEQGSLIYLLKHSTMPESTLKHVMAYDIAKALGKYEPRAIVRGVEVSKNKDKVSVTVLFSLINQGGRSAKIEQACVVLDSEL